MAIQNTTHQQQIVSNNPIQTLERFPSEIWENVISNLIDKSTPLNHITNYTLVSWDFLSVCIKYVKGYQWLCAFKHLNPLAAEKVLHTSTEVAKFGRYNRGPKMLNFAQLESGFRQYYATEKELYILDVTDTQFVMTNIINVQNEITTKFSSILKQHRLQNHDWYIIVNTHTTETGFILITKFGISEWNHKKGTQPECIGFYVPDRHNLNFYPTFLSSTYVNDELYVQCNKFEIAPFKSTEMLHILITNHTAKFTPIKLQEIDNFRLYYSPKSGFYIMNTNILNSSVNFRKSQISSKGLIAQKESELMMMGGTFSFYYYYKINNWIIFNYSISGHNFLLVIDENKFTIAIDEKMNIKMPDSYYSEYFCIMNDFIFIFYKDKRFRAIHIPTKTELTEQFTPFLEPYLKQNYAVWAINFCKKPKGFFLQMLLQFKDEYNYYDLALTSVEIPLQLSFTSSKESTNDNAK